MTTEAILNQFRTTVGGLNKINELVGGEYFVMELKNYHYARWRMSYEGLKLKHLRGEAKEVAEKLQKEGLELKIRFLDGAAIGSPFHLIASFKN